MGRPLNKKFFGNRNIGSSTVTTDDGIGGQGVGSVVVSGTFSGKTTTVSGAANPYTIPASVISAPQLPGGVKPTLTITFATASTATVTVVDGGSGYTAIPTISGAALQALGGGSGTVVLTAVLAVDSGSVGSATNQENAISITAYIPAVGEAGYISGAGGSSAVAADIMRQSGRNKYVVRTAQGVGRVKLVAATPTKGQASIIATDSAGGTYYVTELRGRRAHIIKGDQTGTQFTTGNDGIDVAWTFNGASGTKVYNSQPYLAAGVNVKIANA